MDGTLLRESLLGGEPMDSGLIVAIVVPLLAALVFQVPRRTLLLAKETEILSRLDPESDAHLRLNAHVEDLVEREIESNKNWLWITSSLEYGFFATYGLLLLLVGLDLGGWWLIAVALGALLLVLLLTGTVARLLPADSAFNRSLRKLFRIKR